MDAYGRHRTVSSPRPRGLTGARPAIPEVAPGPARLALLAALALLGLLVLAAPAAAHPVSHSDGPRIVNPRPAPGEVVAEDRDRVAALVATDHALASHDLLIDGQPVSATASSGSHPTVAAAPDLAPGSHVAELSVTDTAGRQTRRLWRFTVSGFDVDRLAGSGRVETAVRISRDRYASDDSADAAVLARSDDFPDALAGGPLAGTVDGPLLLTRPDELSQASADELQRILDDGATVYLLGGESALSDQVTRDVEDLGLTVERLAGGSRYATATEIAQQVPESSTAVVVSGRTFADALSVSSPAAARGWPILLTRPDRLPAETEDHLAEHGFDRVVVVGGPVPVSDAVVDGLRDVVDQVERVAGEDRYETAAAVGERFFPDAAEVAVTSGQDFPDALAGGPHAASREAPLLLTSTRLRGPQEGQLRALPAERATVYGGPSVVGDRVVDGLRRARASADGPRVTGVDPADGLEVHTLDKIVVSFDREIELGHSSLHVTVGGNEVTGSLGGGEFDDTMVFAAAELPAGAGDGARHSVRVTGVAYDGQEWGHVDHRLSYRKLDLSRGDTGPAVRSLQERLRDRGYWLGSVDGNYGTLTHQAVMAFQKVHGLEPDGIFGRTTRETLERDPAGPSARSDSGRWIEIDLERQVLMAVANGRVEWIFNTSTGHGRVYEFEGQTFRATTTTGKQRMVRQIDELREAARGALWRPKYFDGSRGIAVHGSRDVPNYPASAGCVRVTYPAMDFIWENDLAPIGTGVWVYPDDHYG